MRQQLSTVTLLMLPDSIAAMGEGAAKSLGSLTGWRWKGGDKDRPFSVRCKAFGIMFHLKRVLTESPCSLSTLLNGSQICVSALLPQRPKGR